MSTRPRTPQEIKPILRALSESDAVIIGGQGINIWSCIYEKPDSEPWRSSRPYTSIDADALADRAEMAKLARSLEQMGFNITVQVPRTDQESSVNTGLIVARKGTVEFDINLLHSVLGVSNQDLRTNAVSILWEDTPLRLIHPLLCVESKTHNLLRLEQDNPEEPRQDKKHLLLAVGNLREHLIHRSTSAVAGQSLHIARRLVDFAYQEPGRAVLTQHRVDVLGSVPWESWREGAVSELQTFALREAEFRREIQQRVEAEAELARWIEQLKNRPE